MSRDAGVAPVLDAVAGRRVHAAPPAAVVAVRAVAPVVVVLAGIARVIEPAAVVRISVSIITVCGKADV